MQRKVIGYVRVNVCAESDLASQISRLQGAGAVEVLSDIQSGSSKERVGLNRLIALIEADQVKEVVMTRVDRLSRSLIQVGQFVAVCRRKGVILRFLEQNLSLLGAEQDLGTALLVWHS